MRGFDVTYSGIFRDNLRQPGAGSSLFKTEPYGLEGVSILRGPSSALYGASGAGGLYNLITKRPTVEPLHEVQVQYGSHARKQGQFDVSGPLGEDEAVLYRMTGLLRSADTSRFPSRTTAPTSRPPSPGSRMKTRRSLCSANIPAPRPRHGGLLLWTLPETR